MTEIDDLKCMIKIIQAERDQSSDEELNKQFDRTMNIETPRRKKVTIEESPTGSPSPPHDLSLSMLSGPKFFVKVQFKPDEYKPYLLDCMIDSGCQVNLARGSALPHFYWENISTHGEAIEGTTVPITAKAELFPVQFNKVSDKLTLYRLYDLSDDCVLGSEFLHQVSPFAVDT